MLINVQWSEGTEVMDNPALGHTHPRTGLTELFPVVSPTLAFTVNPFEQESFSVVDESNTASTVVRDGVIIEVSANPCSCTS